MLTPRGFTLTPQGDIDEPEPSAVFEADPDDFGRRYPGFADSAEDLAGSCIDLWVHYDATTARIRCELEGDDLVQLYRDLGYDPPSNLPTAVSGDHETQLAVWAPALAHLLDTAATSPPHQG